MRPLLLFTCSLCLAACTRHVPPAIPVSSCEAPAGPTEGWTEAGEQQYTLRLPPGMRKSLVAGIDAAAGRYAGGGLEVIAAYGPYAGQSDAGQVGIDTCTRQVGGRTAQIRSYRDRRTGEYIVDAYWPQAGPPLALGVPNLYLLLRSDRPEMWAAMLAIVHGVRFTDPR